MTEEQKALREAVAKIISGAPFPSARSFSKADEVITAVLERIGSMSEFCEHETFKDICGICHRDTQITALRAENERLRAALQRVDDDHGYGLPPDTRSMIRAALGDTNV